MSTDENLSRELSGRYRIGQKIGAGGMGTLYEGVQLGLDRPVAIKLIKPNVAASEESVERFRREAKAIAKMTHPNIVAIHDFDSTQEGHLYLVMELIRGESVRERLRRAGPLSPDEAERVVRGVASALKHAHAAQIVHRDIKPENVMIAEDGQIKVLDFGIARMLDSGEKGVTETGIVVGTAGYVAPEMIHLGDVDARGDLFSLGMLWVEMLLGRFPFEAATPMALMLRAANTDLPPLKTMGIDVDDETAQLIGTLAQRNRDQRIQSADLLLAALDGAPFARTQSAAPPTHATPLPVTETSDDVRPVIALEQHTMLTADLARRNRSTSIIAGAALAVAIAAVAFMVWFVVKGGANGGDAPDMPVASTVQPLAAPEKPDEVSPPPTSPPTPEPAPPVAEETKAPPVVEEEPKKASAKKRRRVRRKKTKTTEAVAVASVPDPAPEEEKKIEEAPKGPTSRDIKDALRAAFGKATSCSNTNLKARRGGGILVDHCPSYDSIEGRQFVRITVAPDGEVLGAKFTKSSVADAKIGACTLKSIKSWRFPAFNGDEPITISQPIAFEQCVPINGRCVY